MLKMDLAFEARHILSFTLQNIRVGVDQGVGAVVWSPLGWGKLTGRIRRGQPAKPGMRAHDIAGTGPHYDEERLFRIIDALDVVSAETGKTIPQIALNWLLQRPSVSSVIIGARDEAQRAAPAVRARAAPRSARPPRATRAPGRSSAAAFSMARGMLSGRWNR